MANEKKQTQVELYKEILDTYALSEKHKEFLEGRMAQVAKKNASTASGERKPTKEQIANTALSKAIYEGMEENRLYTSTEISKAIPECAGMTPQKITPRMGELVEAGMVEKTTEKRKNYYKKIVVVPADVEEEG